MLRAKAQVPLSAPYPLLGRQLPQFKHVKIAYPLLSSGPFLDSSLGQEMQTGLKVNSA